MKGHGGCIAREASRTRSATSGPWATRRPCTGLAESGWPNWVGRTGWLNGLAEPSAPRSYPVVTSQSVGVRRVAPRHALGGGRNGLERAAPGSRERGAVDKRAIL